MDQRNEPSLSLSGFHEGLAAFAEPRLPAPAELISRLVVSERLIDSTLRELESRSAGRRESAAVWCGRVDGNEWRATDVRFHHRVCNDLAGALRITLTEEAKFRLYEEMNSLGLTLIAAVHTHPDDWVGLSHVDQRNQLSSKDGFWSLVLPRYGRRPLGPSEMGVHIRLHGAWWRLTETQVSKHFRIEV